MLLQEIPKHPDFKLLVPSVGIHVNSVSLWADIVELVQYLTDVLNFIQLQMSSQAVQDMQRLQPTLELHYNAWLVSRPSKRTSPNNNAVSDKTSNDQGPLQERSLQPCLPYVRSDRHGVHVQAPQPLSRRHLPTPTLQPPAEMLYIPMLKIEESIKPPFLRASTSPSWSHQGQRRVMSASGLVHTEKYLPSSSIHSPTSFRSQHGSNGDRLLSTPLQLSLLKGINPGPAFDSKQKTRQAAPIPPKPVILPPPVRAAYQPHPRRPATMIPIHKGEDQREHSPPQIKAVRIPILSSDSSTSSTRSSFSQPQTGPVLRPKSAEEIRISAKTLTQKHTLTSSQHPRNIGNRLFPLEGGSNLRSLLLPSNLVDVFAEVASPNTDR